MEREVALKILKNHIKSEHLIKHSLAVEAIMKGLAKRLKPDDVDFWGLAGLMHDLDADIIDYEINPETHGFKTVELLKTEAFGNETMYQAILAHNEKTGVAISSVMDRVLYAADPIAGFITAIALIYPDKKISSVKLKSITKRMGELRFAAGANREAMKSIEMINIPFIEFAEIALNSMTEIADDLGL